MTKNKRKSDPKFLTNRSIRFFTSYFTTTKPQSQQSSLDRYVYSILHPTLLVINNSSIQFYYEEMTRTKKLIDAFIFFLDN